jgi:hypothetical protein
MKLPMARSLAALLAVPLLLAGCPSAPPTPPAEESEGSATAPAAEAAPPEEAAVPEEVDLAPTPEAGADAGSTEPTPADGSGAAALPGLQLQRPTMQLRPSIQNTPAGGLQIRPTAAGQIRPATPQAVQPPRLQLAPQ